MNKHLARLGSFLLLGVGLASCSVPPLIDPAYKEVPAQQADAGYASASVVAMLPLSEARSVLAANSTLTFALAYSYVQSYSRHQHQQALNSLQLGVNVGLSGRTSSSTTGSSDSRSNTSQGSTTVSDFSVTPASSSLANSTRTTSTTTTAVDSAGKSSSTTAVQTVVQGTATAPELGDPMTLPGAKGSMGTPTISPALAVQAADQLMKIHNMAAKQFDAIPFSPTKQKAFVVQLKTTLQPHKPALPLDAFVTVTAVPDFTKYPVASISLIPLAFGTEEYEFSQLGSADTYMRGLAFGLSAVSPGGAFSGQARSVVGRVLEATAVNVNGLISATPVSPSTVQVRLGAMWQGANDRVMIPRSFNGFFVLLVPIDYSGDVELVAKPLFRDPKTGDFVGGTPPQSIVKEIKGEFCTFGLVLERGCVYSAGVNAPATSYPEDDWFAFLRRIRRNEYEVLRCVGVLSPTAAVPIPKPGGDETCPSYADSLPRVAMVKYGTPKSVAPSFVLGSFISEINRVGLKVRSSSSFVSVP